MSSRRFQPAARVLVSQPADKRPSSAALSVARGAPPYNSLYTYARKLCLLTTRSRLFAWRGMPKVGLCIANAGRASRMTRSFELSATRRLHTRTGRTAATSAPGLGAPLPHLHRDWAHPLLICTGTGLTPATSAPGLGSLLPHLHRDWAPHAVWLRRRRAESA